MRVGIHGKSFNKRGQEAIVKIFSLLEESGVFCQVSPKFAEILHERNWERSYEKYKPGDSQNLPDFILSLGGDGTMLESITHFGPSQIPILGINLGRLGYLASTSIDNLEEAIHSMLSGEYEIDERALLHLETEGDIFNKLNFALNDFTIIKSDSSSMIAVKTYVDDQFLNTYWADGIIVATPTGSTGYSLSCGGPIVVPQSNNFIITPVAPHNLTIRPLVISLDSEITFEIGGRSKTVLVSLDSRSTTIPKGSVIKISKEKFSVKLVKINGSSNFETLRKKLSWGLDTRNWSDFDIASE